MLTCRRLQAGEVQVWAPGKLDTASGIRLAALVCHPKHRPQTVKVKPKEVCFQVIPQLCKGSGSNLSLLPPCFGDSEDGKQEGPAKPWRRIQLGHEDATFCRAPARTAADEHALQSPDIGLEGHTTKTKQVQHVLLMPARDEFRTASASVPTEDPPDSALPSASLFGSSMLPQIGDAAGAEATRASTRQAQGVSTEPSGGLALGKNQVSGMQATGEADAQDKTGLWNGKSNALQRPAI